MDLPTELDTSRLRLRRPTRADAQDIFDRFAADADVTRYMSWPRHRALDDTLEFLESSDREWNAHGTGPYLVFAGGGQLVGATGIHFETPYRASTGYALARDAWGHGYATEVAREMATQAFRLPGLTRLYALCHVEHAASARVLEKAGFEREGVLRRYLLFPNLASPDPSDVLLYARVR